MVRPALLAVILAVAAAPAEARFGKKSSSATRSISQSDERADGAEHGASAVSEPASYRSAPAGGVVVADTGYAYRRHRGFGYGFGYSYCYQPALVAAAPAGAPTVDDSQSAPIRFTVGVEGQGYVGGVTLGALATFEGERWGVSLSAADIIVRADDGTPGFDHIGDFTAHLTYAFIAGQYGRLRVELGADAFAAPDIAMVGPTLGLSGVLWFGGPLGVEGSISATPWPFTQIDARAALVLGIENWGLRAGWRVQALNDRGLVDGVAHGDIFNGPYLGLSYVF